MISDKAEDGHKHLRIGTEQFMKLVNQFPLFFLAIVFHFGMK